MKRLMLTTTVILVVALEGLCQSGKLIDSAVQAEVLSVKQTAHMTAAAADIVRPEEAPDDTVDVLQELGYGLPGPPEASARAKDLAFLMVHSFDLRGGLRYGLTGSAVAAFRELQARALLPPDMSPGYILSGAEVVDLLHRFIEHTRSRTESDQADAASASGAEGATRSTSEAETETQS